MKALVAVTKDLPVGTNLGLLHTLWALVSGALLPGRGALIPALQRIGLEEEVVRRAWRALRGGQWQIGELLKSWQSYVEGMSGWAVHRHEGYRTLAVDVTAFFRPALKNCPSKHYHPQAQRALPAVIMGIVGEVGEIGGQRLACPRRIERVHPKEPSEMRLWIDLLRQVRHELAEDGIAVLDAGVKISDLQAAGIERYVVRLAKNFTAQRNRVAAYQGTGRPPVYGETVRPLPRSRKGNLIAGTPPDRTDIWQFEARSIRAEIWNDLILPDALPGPDTPSFQVVAIYDPDFDQPWLLATPLPLQPSTVCAIYRDRWPVEQIPLAAKQMLGAHRQFVHAPECIQRLPELALLAGSILSFLAASAPAVPTGFWDKQPKPTPGRFRRALMGCPFPDSCLLPRQLRKKQSVTAHLPKGILAHRRQPALSSPQVSGN
jgi:hypothetical protein